MRTPLRLLVLALAAALGALVLTAPAQAAAPSCSTTWGSLAKGHVAPSGVPLTDVRAGRHACFDRLVVDLRTGGRFTDYRVRYVGQVREDPSDRPVPLRGAADLLITLGATDHTPAGRPTYAPANRRELANVSGFRTFRQVAWAGSFEGLTQIGLGVRARLPFRVFTASGPTPGHTRVIVDVAHSW